MPQATSPPAYNEGHIQPTFDCLKQVRLFLEHHLAPGRTRFVFSPADPKHRGKLLFAEVVLAARHVDAAFEAHAYGTRSLSCAELVGKVDVVAVDSRLFHTLSR